MSRRERRQGLHIPDVPRDKGQPELNEERFQYILQLLTGYEQNNIERMQVVLDELAKHKQATTALAQTFMKMEQEMLYIMKMVGYSEDARACTI